MALARINPPPGPTGSSAPHASVAARVRAPPVPPPLAAAAGVEPLLSSGNLEIEVTVKKPMLRIPAPAPREAGSQPNQRLIRRATASASAWCDALGIRTWLMFAALGGGVTALTSPSEWGGVVRGIAGWNAFVVIWIGVVVGLLSRASPSGLARRAVQYNLGWIVMLAIVSIAVMASLGAIVQLLSDVKNLPLADKAPHLLASIATIASSWIALHTLYTFHYIQQYYAPAHDLGVHKLGGLEFPATPAPTFGDFLYFSFTIGATSQTSDIVISSPTIRRIVMVHALLSFAFNTAVLAVTVNIAAGVV